MFKQIRTFMVLATTLGLLLGSCKKGGNKDQDTPIDPPPTNVEPKPEVPVADQLKVYFDETTVDFSRYDSGFVTLQKEGSSTQILKRFVKGEKVLKVDIDGLAEGKYQANMFINIKLKNDNKVIWRQFRWKKDIQLVKAGVVVKAPVNELKKDWLPYVVISDVDRSFHLTVPMDVADPWFEINVRDTKWDYFYMERAAYKRTGPNTKTPLGAWSFQCDNDCYDNNRIIIDSELFKNWSAETSAKQWDNADVNIMLMNQQSGEERQIWHNFDIPDLQ